MTAIVQAAVRVTAAAGLRGLTHRAVDSEAGLPQGSTSAYLRTRAALLDAMATYVADRVSADIAALTSAIDKVGTDRDFAVAQTTRTFVSWLRHPDLLLTRLELYIEAARRPELAAVLARSRRRLVDAVTPRLETGLGPAVARTSDVELSERAETLVAAVDGILLEALRRPVRGRRAFVQRSVEMLLRMVEDVG